MSLTGSFNQSTQSQAYSSSGSKPKKKRKPPFSLRLSKDERLRLEAEAAGAPLGAYIKAKLIGGSSPILVKRRQTGYPVEDRKSLAQALALLGQSRIANNLNQLAHAANIGALPMTPETEAELVAALRDVRRMRHLLLAAVGLKPEGEP